MHQGSFTYSLRILFLLTCVGLFASCDRYRLVDENKTLPTEGWYYKDNLVFDLVVSDTNKLYNTYVNLRVDGDYKYSNIFLWVKQIDPMKQEEKKRVEIRLAAEDGKWLGKGLGDVMEYRSLVSERIKFHRVGIYRMALEQNMRDDTLSHVISAGVRVEEWHEGKQ
jgi:gliding motility-associated lipoprotein GldH